jgi:uroporphyrinogen decarboxylase
MPSYQKIRSRIPFKTLCYEPELIEKVTRLPVEELGVDAAIVFSDILLLLEPLGFNVEFEERTGPIITPVLHDLERVPSLTGIADHFEFLQKAVRSLTTSLRVPLIGFAGAPFTLASYLIEGKTSKNLAKTKRLAWQFPEAFSKLIDTLLEAVALLLKLQIEAGCQAVQLFDTWADTLPETDFDTWCIAPLKKLVERLSPYKVPLVYFCRGSSYRHKQIASTGVHAISIDPLKPLSSIRKALPSLPLQGNLAPEALLLSQDRLEYLLKEQLAPMAHDPAYIFNLGHGILPETPYSNVKFLVEKVRTCLHISIG